MVKGWGRGDQKAGFRRKAAPQCLHLLLRTLECLFGVGGGLVSLGQSRFGGLSSFGPGTDAGATPTDLSVECLGGLASRLGR